MQVLFTQFVGKPVIGVQNSDHLGILKDVVIKQESLKIIALAVSLKHKKESYYLLPNDIRFFNKDKILVDSFQKLSELSELIRYENDILHNYKIIGKKVQTVSKKKLGKVSNYMFDPAHYYVTKLSVKPNIFKSFLYTKLLIDRDNIIDTNKKYITVRDNYAKLKKSVPAVLPARS